MTEQEKHLTVSGATWDRHKDQQGGTRFWILTGFWHTKHNQSPLLRTESQESMDCAFWFTHRLSRLLVHVRIGKSCIILAPRNILEQTWQRKSGCQSDQRLGCHGGNRTQDPLQHNSMAISKRFKHHKYYTCCQAPSEDLRQSLLTVICQEPDSRTYREWRSDKFWKAEAPT